MYKIIRLFDYIIEKERKIWAKQVNKKSPSPQK